MTTRPSPRRIAHVLLASLVLAIALGGVGARGAAAQVTPTATIDPATSVADGQRITVSWVGMEPGVQANIVISGEFPWGDVPERLNFEELGRSISLTGADGSGSTTFLAHVSHGVANDGKPLVCGRDGQRCWVVVVQHPERQPLVAGAEITFSDAAVSTATMPTTTAAPVTRPAELTPGATPVGSTSSRLIGWLIAGAIVAVAAGVLIVGLTVRHRTRPDPPAPASLRSAAGVRAVEWPADDWPEGTVAGGAEEPDAAWPDDWPDDSPEEVPEIPPLDPSTAYDPLPPTDLPRDHPG